jgi:hypothetical protein
MSDRDKNNRSSQRLKEQEKKNGESRDPNVHSQSTVIQPIIQMTQDAPKLTIFFPTAVRQFLTKLAEWETCHVGAKVDFTTLIDEGAFLAMEAESKKTGDLSKKKAVEDPAAFRAALSKGAGPEIFTVEQKLRTIKMDYNVVSWPQRVAKLRQDYMVLEKICADKSVSLEAGYLAKDFMDKVGPRELSIMLKEEFQGRADLSFAQVATRAMEDVGTVAKVLEAQQKAKAQSNNSQNYFASYNDKGSPRDSEKPGPSSPSNPNKPSASKQSPSWLFDKYTELWYHQTFIPRDQFNDYKVCEKCRRKHSEKVCPVGVKEKPAKKEF